MKNRVHRLAEAIPLPGLLAICVLVFVPAIAHAVSIPICTAPGDQRLPVIGENWIAWEDWRDGATNLADIYAYNIENASERVVSALSADQWSVAVWGSRLVWMDARNAPPDTRYDIYSFDLTSGVETPVSISLRNKWSPDIYGTRVVWDEQTRGNDWDIKSAVIGGPIQTICSAPGGQFDPAIHGNIIAWHDERNGLLFDLYGYNLALSSEFPICTASGDQDSADVWGNLVVWSDRRTPASKADIYLKDISTGIERPICTAGGDQLNPSICGNLIVWADFRNGSSNPDIYGYDLATGREVALATGPESQDFPQVFGDKVVYEQGDPGSIDVYMTFFEPAAYQETDISEARLQVDGTAVRVSGNIVTAQFGGVFYVEDEQRHRGIRVQWPGLIPLGTTVTVSGRMRTANGERYIDALNVTTGPVKEVPAPVFVKIGDLGGGPPNAWTPAVPFGVGVHNLGLLVRTCGIVESVADTYFYLNDGSGPTGMRAKVICGAFNKPREGDFVSVTGICTTAATQSGFERAVRVRFATDITIERQAM